MSTFKAPPFLDGTFDKLQTSWQDSTMPTLNFRKIKATSTKFTVQPSWTVSLNQFRRHMPNFCIHGHIIFSICGHAHPQGSATGGGIGGEHVKKAFVGGLARSTTQAEVKEYFEGYLHSHGLPVGREFTRFSRVVLYPFSLSLASGGGRS